MYHLIKCAAVVPVRVNAPPAMNAYDPDEQRWNVISVQDGTYRRVYKRIFTFFRKVTSFPWYVNAVLWRYFWRIHLEFGLFLFFAEMRFEFFKKFLHLKIKRQPKWSMFTTYSSIADVCESTYVVLMLDLTALQQLFQLSVVLGYFGQVHV